MRVRVRVRVRVRFAPRLGNNKIVDHFEKTRTRAHKQTHLSEDRVRRQEMLPVGLR